MKLQYRIYLIYRYGICYAPYEDNDMLCCIIIVFGSSVFMFLPVSLFIGLRYSRSKNHSGFVSFITFFSIAGILLGVAALITVVSVMNGFEGELKKRILGIVPHITLVNEEQQPIDNWQELSQFINVIDKVEKVTPLISNEALIQSVHNLQGVLLQGIRPSLESDNLVANNMVSGKLSDLENTPYSIVIGQSLARKLNVSKGDNLRIILPNQTRFTPMGRIPVQRTFVIVGLFSLGSQVDDSVVYTHSSNARKLLRLPANSFTELRLYLRDAFDAPAVINKLRNDSKFTHLSKNLELSSWQESQGTLFSAVKMEKNMMWLMLSLVVAVAAFNIVSALVMVVIDKQAEIGILQTLGLNRHDILKIFLTQGLFNGVFGTTFGVVLGMILTFFINDILAVLGLNLFGAGYTAQQLPIDFQLTDLVIIIVGTLLVTLIASFYPAYRASKTLPAEVLRNE